MRNVVTPGRLSNTRVVTRESANGFEIYRASGVMDALGKLDNIIDRTKAQELKQTFFDGASLVAEEVRAAAPPPSPATLVKGWVPTRQAIFIARGDPAEPNVVVGVSRNAAPQALWDEYGTEARTTKRSNANRGEMPPQPFFRPAVNRVRDAVAQFIGLGIKEIVEKAAEE